jgi:predicted RNA-binding protein with PUA-like domain
MAFWLLKTEPSTYSYADLERDGRTPWTGVKNPQAQASLRAMKPGDRAVVYHSGSKEAVGLAEVVTTPYPDPTGSDPRMVCVDVRAAGSLPSPVPLEALKKQRAFAGSPLLRQGRLSVLPLTAEQWQSVEALARGRDAGARGAPRTPTA